MRRLMALLQITKRTPRRRWGFYMLLMVKGLYLSSTLTLHVNHLGAGALASPLVATQFAQLHRWSFHYLTSLAVAMLNTVLIVCIFKFKTQDGRSHFLPLPKSMSDLMVGPQFRVFCPDWSGYRGERGGWGQQVQRNVQTEDPPSPCFLYFSLRRCRGHNWW